MSRKTEYLATDQLQPVVDLAGCYEFPAGQRFVYRIPSHHLILIESGRIEGKTTTGRFEAQAGDLVCFRPTEQNEYGTLAPTLFYQAHLQFAPPPRHRLTAWLDGIGPFPEQLRAGDQFDALQRRFEMWCLELSQPGESHQLRCRAAVLELVALVADLCTRQTIPRLRLDAWQRARLRLGSDFRAGLTIEQIARSMGVSTDHFIRQFQQRFGATPKAFQMQARLQEAARLLRSGDQPAKAIAFHTGFTDPKSFARAFKRHFGVAPSDLRLEAAPVPLRARTDSATGFVMNRHVLPPHAGPGYLLRWQAGRARRRV